MVVIDLLRPDVPVIINGQEIPPMDLGKHKGPGLKDIYQTAEEDSAAAIEEEVWEGGKKHDIQFMRQHFWT